MTFVIAPAGYGKTTALLEAIAANRLAPLGQDAWVDAVRTDRSGSGLLSAVADALGTTGRDTTAGTIAAIADAVWTAAPERVAIVIDDVHELDDPGAIVAPLLDALPANGSLVLGSRRPVDVPVARLRAHGAVLEFSATDLELTDDELARLHELRGGGLDLAELPRHAASADLQLVAGTSAGAEFVWEEILSRIDADRMAVLRRSAVLETLDDELIAALSDGAFDADTLFGGLPLVDRSETGRTKMHEILRNALLPRLEPGERVKALSIAGDAERRRHRLASAVELFDAAGDEISAIDCAREWALGPLLLGSSADGASVRRVVSRLRPDSHLNVVFDAYRHYVGNETRGAAALIGAADAARAANDDDVEVDCRQRAAQLTLLQHHRGYEAQVERIAEIAERNRLGAAVGRYYASIEAQLAGDGARSRAALDDIGALDALGPMHSLQVRAERMSDLGRPEEVIAGLDQVDQARLPAGAGQWIGMAMLQCAVTSPEDVLPLVLGTAAASERRGYSHPATFTHSVATIVAIACGERAVAQRHARLGRDHAETGVGPTAEALVRLAEAALLVDAGDEAAAVDHLAGASTGGAACWPGRSELWALPLAYVLHPERRSVIDAADIGPTLRTARTAARALISLRDGDVEPAAALPWHQQDLLRIHVPRMHLAELACTVHDRIPEAGALLQSLPDHRLLLAQIAASDSPAAAAAQQVVDTVPVEQPFRLRIDLLGPVTVHRSATDAVDGVTETTDLSRRPKAAELVALLAERRRLDRFETIAQVWADHDDERKALGSLRTTLSSLNDALDPNRAKGTTAFHLRTEGDLLELDARVVTDVEEFEALIASARADDDGGIPRRALETYERALTLYRGDFLHGLDAGWAELARVRLRGLAIGAMCRVGELVAARGEPEVAARWAERALGFDPLDERAMRCLVSSQLASGDVSSARQSHGAAVERLTAAGLEPSPELRRIAERLG